MVAIALSGGGARGDFEVGALNFLYDQGIRPDVICGTSVGAVNSLKLCEDEGGPNQGLAGLTGLWLGLDSYSDFFAEQPWLLQDIGLIRLVRRYVTDFAALNAHALEQRFAVNPVLKTLLSDEQAARERRLADADPLSDFAPLAAEAGVAYLNGLLHGAASLPSMISLGINAVELVSKMESLLQTVTQQTALFNLEPTRQKALQNLDLNLVERWAARGKQLRLTMVGLRSGALHYANERGHVLERDGTPITRGTLMPAACEINNSAVTALEEQIADLEEIRPRPPAVIRKLRTLRMQLEAARADLNACLRAHPPQPAPVIVNLIDAMIASASIPVFFPPVMLQTDRYVDGGVREVLPVQAAIDCGADRVFAISASSPEVEPVDGTTHFWLATIAQRSLMEIAINEVAFNDLRVNSGQRALDIKAIFPRVDIHSMFVLYPAFIRNRMAYGYMCAGDVVAPPADAAAAAEARSIADRIAILRYGVARLECWVRFKPVPPALVMVPITSEQRDQALRMLAAMKAEIGTLVAQRRALGAVMPPVTAEWGNANLWSVREEVHPWNRSGAVQDDAALSYEHMPATVVRGGTLHIRVSAYNTGTSNWTAAAGYQLAIDPRVNAPPVSLPATLSVPPATVHVFSFSVPAPAQSMDDFECRMVHAGVPFGEASPAVRIIVTQAGEPPHCAQIRRQIATLRAQIAQLEDQIDAANPRASAPLRGMIAGKEQEIAALSREASGLQCAL